MNLGDVETQIEKIKRLVPNGNDPRDFITESLLAMLRTNEPVSMGVVALSRNNEIKRRITSGLETASNINDSLKIAQSPEGIVALYTIEWILRPSLPIKNGRIEKLQDGIWKDVEPDVLEAQSKSVCRIDLTHIGHLGTGFIVRETDECYVIFTNAHVVEAALNNYWQKIDYLKLKCSFDLENNEFESKFYELADNYYIHDIYDLGILYLPKEKTGFSSSVLDISYEIPESFEDLQVGVIGHPSFNTDKDPFPKIFGFGDQFGIKRLSLGFVKEMGEREWRNKKTNLLLHDCTTLSGSSGSCIIDLGTKKVIGLHFGGWHHSKNKITLPQGDILATLFEANGAVPLWLLSDLGLL